MTSSSPNYTRHTTAMLWAHSANRCYFPDCDFVCVEEAIDVASPRVSSHIAHIVARNDGGPRADPSMSQKERNAHPNLILLCPNHHGVVDGDEEKYTVQVLHRWKRSREEQTRELFKNNMPNVTFTELETITKALIANHQPSTDSLTIIPHRQKLARNGLTECTEYFVTIGLIKVKQVQSFVETIGGQDHTYADRLKTNFIGRYQDFKNSGLDGDALFAELMKYSAQGRTDFLHMSAGLAVLVYLFERCEVFEH